MDATYIYGIGFSPHPCVIEITSGIATAAVAVFEVTSDNSSVAVRMIRIVTKPPFISREEITSPSAFATPVALIRLPSARPPANIHQIPDDLSLHLFPDHDPFSLFICKKKGDDRTDDKYICRL